MKIPSRLRRGAALLSVMLFAFSGCGAKRADAVPASGAPAAAGLYEIPEFCGAEFHAELAEDFGNVQLDASALEQGVVALRAVSDSRMKFQIVCGETKYNYDLVSGEPAVLPLNMGNGSYTFRLMEQVEGSKYACTWSQTRPVTMADEFQTFLHPSQLVAYDRDSQCVAKARELAAACDTDAEVASAIYGYLVDNIQYDRKKADTVQSGYLPDPDDTLTTGKGICFDYASLAAAMMRSLGIPCKLITGYVGQDTYHAWNSFYLQEQGWVTVEIRVSPNSWQRVDITFAASGTPADALMDDSRYTTRYTY